jgi:hypothetical protein
MYIEDLIDRLDVAPKHRSELEKDWLSEFRLKYFPAASSCGAGR